MSTEVILYAGALAMAVLQLLKWVWRKFVIKDPSYSFPPWVYTLFLPVLEIAVVPLLAFLGFEGYGMPTSWLEFARVLLQAFLSTLVSLVAYNAGYRPLREYIRGYRK